MAYIKKEGLSTEELALASQVISGSNKSDRVSELLEQILSEQVKEKEEARRIALEARKQNALEMERNRKRKRLEQESCPHLKPNRQSNLAGTRDHSGNTHYVCQYCGKYWKGSELPPILQIPAEYVGGPLPQGV